jgi:hypothetical protein
MQPKILALPRERIERALCNIGVTAEDVWVLLRSDDWCALHSRNEQLVFFYEFVKTKYSRSLTWEVLGQAFGTEPPHAEKYVRKLKRNRNLPIGPSHSIKIKKTAVVAFIENGHRTRNHISQRDVLSFIEKNFQKCLSYQ